MGRVAASVEMTVGGAGKPSPDPSSRKGKLPKLQVTGWRPLCREHLVGGGLSGTTWLGLGQLFFSHTKTIASGHWLGTETGRVNNFNAKSAALLIRV